jgi:site-specific DNA-methyltransferase (adenine-specific)
LLEFNKVYNMNCLDGLKEIPDKSIDLIVTDPPYFLPVQSYVGTRKNGYNKRSLADTSILKGFFDGVFIELSRVLKDNGTYYVFCDAQSYPIFYQTMFPLCKHVRLLIWDKLVSYNGYTWRHQHELIAWGELEKTERIPTGDGDIIKCRGVLQKDRNHPAEKPIDVIEKLIQKSSKENDIILDPFMGSGTTALACKNLNRQFIGFELCDEYIETINNRLSMPKNNQI